MSDAVAICSGWLWQAATSVGSSTCSFVSKLSEPISFFANTIVLVFFIITVNVIVNVLS
ncbi:hypothetical protein [Bartonella vinsonii]|uniref:hypothetical protein n=1 Tax=Bartonella vinsonii TaxID=33047 RepID=UPI0030844BCF